MITYIKSGYWEKKDKAPLKWLDLNNLIKDGAYYTKFINITDDYNISLYDSVILIDAS